MLKYNIMIEHLCVIFVGDGIKHWLRLITRYYVGRRIREKAREILKLIQQMMRYPIEFSTAVCKQTKGSHARFEVLKVMIMNSTIF
jgi:hypothetical protein